MYSAYLSDNNIAQNSQELLVEFFGDEDYEGFRCADLRSLQRAAEAIATVNAVHRDPDKVTNSLADAAIQAEILKGFTAPPEPAPSGWRVSQTCRNASNHRPLRE